MTTVWLVAIAAALVPGIVYDESGAIAFAVMVFVIGLSFRLDLSGLADD